MKTNHTPAPWFVHKEPRESLNPGNYFVSNHTQPGAATFVCSTFPHQPPGCSEESNARLIAAAPDLLAFAIKVAHFNPSLFPEVHELIRKATGQPVVSEAEHNAYPKGRWS